MPAPSIIVFDLDGTLIDSRPGIVSSLVHVAEQVGVRLDSPESLDDCIGPPLAQVFAHEWNLDGDEVRHALRLYKKHYLSVGMLDARVYAGVVALLDRLRGMNALLAVATAKPLSEATGLLEAHRLGDRFPVVEGLEGSTIRKSPKKAVVERAVNRLRADASATSSAIMVGDRDLDMRAARECGLIPLGVSYGYGSREELRLAGAQVVVDSVSGLSAELDGLLR